MHRQHWTRFLSSEGQESAAPHGSVQAIYFMKKANPGMVRPNRCCRVPIVRDASVGHALRLRGPRYRQPEPARGEAIGSCL
jgi:hypothetical protein